MFRGGPVAKIVDAGDPLLVGPTQHISHTSHKPPGRVLVAQGSTKTGSYRTLLNITGNCNEKWAHMHGHQYRAITGIYLDDELESICRTQPNFQAASAFNGLGMLFDAARANHVDFFLYLDADAIVTTPKDVVGLMRSSNPDALLWAEKGWYEHVFWDINNGVFLWNLRHPLSPMLMNDWHARAVQTRCGKNLARAIDSQGSLQRAIRALSTENRRAVHKVHGFNMNGTYVKHIHRGTVGQHQWHHLANNTRMDHRADLLRRIRGGLAWCA